MNRRSFLGAAAVAPIAAKQAADDAAIRLTRKDSGFRAFDEGPIFQAGGSIQDPRKAFWRWVDDHGLPAELENRFRADAKCISGLDPDLAVLRSMSLAARLAIQFERNYERRLQGERYSYEREGWQQALIAKIGGWIW